MEKQHCQLLRPASRPSAWGRRGGRCLSSGPCRSHTCRPSCLFSSTHGAPALHRHVGVTRMPHAGKNSAHSYMTSNWNFATFQTGRVGVTPLRTGRMYVRNRPGPLTRVVTGGRRAAGHLWGFPSSTCLVQPTDRVRQSPCSGWGGDAAVILMGEGGTASRTFQQSITL